MVGLALSAHAVIVPRTIVIDGNLSDWNGIRDNPGQFTTDAEGTVDPADLDYVVQATGRDLRKFALTFDTTALYLYVERYASTSNRTDWWFYLDVNADGRLQTNEYVLNVRWQGSNRATDRFLWRYVSSVPAGDPLTTGTPPRGDGYDMPGTVTSSVSLPSALRGGAVTGTEMETFVTWSELGLAGPTNIGFHVSSSNGTNLPTQIDDNMDGPGGGLLTIVDLRVTKSVDAPFYPAGTAATFRVTVTNPGAAVGGVTILDNLALAGLTYVSDDSASTGTSYAPATGIWSIGTLPAGASRTLTLSATANPSALTNYTNTAALATYDAGDPNPVNNTASVAVAFAPAPDIVIVKTSQVVRDPINAASNPKAVPGAWLDYRIVVTNQGAGQGEQVVVVDDLPPQGALFVGALGAGGSPIEFIDGAAPNGSGLSFTFTSLASTTDDLDFSANGGADGFTYVPIPDAAGFDGSVTDVRVRPQGLFRGAAPGVTPRFTLRMRVRVD